jgi:hypothetical protein
MAETSDGKRINPSAPKRSIEFATIRVPRNKAGLNQKTAVCAMV